MLNAQTLANLMKSKVEAKVAENKLNKDDYYLALAEAVIEHLKTELATPVATAWAGCVPVPSDGGAAIKLAMAAIWNAVKG